MAKEHKNNDLGYLGVEFEYRLINAFITHPVYFKNLSPIVDQNKFTNQYLKTIVGIIKDYYHKNEIVPSYEMIEFEIRFREYGDNDLQFFLETIGKLKNTTTEGMSDIEEKGLMFFRQQNWIRIANEIIRTAENGSGRDSYDHCLKLINEAVSIGNHTEEATSPLNNIDDDLSKETVTTIPTGITLLDDCLGGGVDKGKMALIIGPSGFGKTSMTTCISANAATTPTEHNNYKGYKVLQIVFEDHNRDIHRKYFSKLTQVETCKLNESEERTKEVKKRLKSHPHKDMINNNIRVMKLNSGEKTATDIKNIIKRKINEGFKPDMVVIDYFECIDGERGSKSLPVHEQEGITMRKFENMAKELDVVLWIPTQGNRESLSGEIVTMDKGSGSIKKQQIAQVVISISRTLEDISNQIATITVCKNRSGSAGKIFNGVTFNNGTCTIDCSSVTSFESVVEYSTYVDEQKNKPSSERKMDALNSL